MITDERKKILRGLGQAQSPEERTWQIENVTCHYRGFGFGQPAPKLEQCHDYEGAILARQERDEV